MKRKFKVVLSALVLGCSVSLGATFFPESKTATNEVELGVEAIQRICPTGMWDGWIFRDINYDRDNNEVILNIQLDSWNEGHYNPATEEKSKEISQWIMDNFMKAYNYLVKNPRISCEGDFMLYLSLGSLFEQMDKDNATLRINLLKPDEENLVMKDIPMTLTNSELKPLLMNE